MDPVLLLGFGPLPTTPHARHAAAGLRTWQLARALEASGVDAELLLVADGPQGRPSGARELSLPVVPLESSQSEPDALRGLLESRRPRALVGATAYGSYLLARSGHPAPLWVDLFGDPAAEGQAASAARADDSPLFDHLWMLNWALRRGDRFSAVSERHRLALLGQLGLAGRLNRWTAGSDLVRVVPEAVAELPSIVSLPTESEFRVVLTGSFNSWVDGEGLLDAIGRVAVEAPLARFVITGGGIEGFLEEPWRRFRDALASLPEAVQSCVELAGWVSDEELDRIERGAACGVVPERALVERVLGSTNRSLRWMARALPVVTTAQSELGEAIERERLGLVYSPGNGAELAAALLTLHRDFALRSELGRRARDWIATHRTIEATTAPLRSWAVDPASAPDRAAEAVSRLARRAAQIVLDQLHLEGDDD